MRTLPAYLLERAAAALSAQFTLEVIEGGEAELRAALASRRIQLALGLVEAGALGTFALLDEPYVMLVGDSHRLAGAVRPEELASEIMIARRSCELLDQTSRFFTRHDVRPRFALRSDSDERCIRMVAAGLGVTTAPLSLRAAGTRPLDVAGYRFRRTIGFRADPGWLAEAETTMTRTAAALLADLAAPESPLRAAGDLRAGAAHLTLDLA